MKLKGIDGGPHKRWSMLVNWMIRQEPYQGLKWEGQLVKASLRSNTALSQVVHGCRQLVS